MPGLDSPTHWLILLVVLMALFGYKKLPDITRSVGRALRIFKTEMTALAEDPVPTLDSHASPGPVALPVRTTGDSDITPTPAHHPRP